MDNREIRFIDSDYNTLFTIPDGGSIVITFDNGEKVTRKCKYLDEYHVEIRGVCYHICEFAERMEQNRNKYNPAPSLDFRLERVEQGEFEYMYANREKVEKGCIGYVRGDFGSNGKDFYSTWFSENESLKTDYFKTEIDNIINHFRFQADNPVLKSRSDMHTTCYNLKPTRNESDLYENTYGFKVKTEKHTYYIYCNPALGGCNFRVHGYDNQALERYKNLQYVEKNLDTFLEDKFYLTPNSVTEVYYNPDATAGGQLVYKEISKELIKEASANSKTTEDFYDYLNGGCVQYLIDIGTSEFMRYAKSFEDRKPDFKNCTKKTMQSLKKYADVKEKDYER